MNTCLNSFGNWELVKTLGSGGFGEVFKWRNAHTNQEIATKHLKYNPNRGEDEITKIKQRYQQELKCLSELKTEFVVATVNVDADFRAYLLDNHAYKLPVIVMEYCNGGDVRTLLNHVRHMNGVKEFVVRQVLNALRHAIEYLHTVCKIEHRDIKPDNIVMHRIGSKCSYKLTDFGFVRDSSENTIQKSVVGTRHYFAPEVIDTARYKNTVDYWSMGVIAFELMCGVLPFIPHRNMYEIIINIKNKPWDCVGIREDLESANSYHYMRHLYEEHCLTSVFVRKIEHWLPLALDRNYKTRGIAPATPNTSNTATDEVQSKGRIRFYTELDSILEMKILTIFFFNEYKFLSYEVTPEMELSQLNKLLERDTHLDHNKFYFVFPLGHPRPVLTKQTRPIDFFVDAWQDTSDKMNPPVMLYLLGYQCDYNPRELSISPMIRKSMINSRDDVIPQWQQQQLERETHFLLMNEYNHRFVFLCGAKDFALQLDHEIFEYQDVMFTLHNEVALINGAINQFSTMINVALLYISNENELYKRYQEEDAGFRSRLQAIAENVEPGVQKRFASANRRIKQVTSHNWDKLIGEDIFGLIDFESHLKGVPSNETSASKLRERADICRTTVNDLLQARHEFVSHIANMGMFQQSADILFEFQKIKSIVQKNRGYLIEINENLQKSTKDLITKLFVERINGYTGSGAATSTAQLQNSFRFMHVMTDGTSNENSNVFNSAPAIIEEAARIRDRMENMMKEDFDVTKK